MLLLLLSTSFGVSADTTTTNSTTSVPTSTITTTNTTTLTTISVLRVGQPPQQQVIDTDAPATLVIQFVPYTSHFNLTILPTLTNSPIKYTVLGGNGIATINALLNQSGTYSISLTINYSSPTSGNLTYDLYSATRHTDSDFIPFQGVNVESLQTTVIAEPYINIAQAVQDALQAKLGYLITLFNQTQTQNLNMMNQEMNILSVMLVVFMFVSAFSAIGTYVLLRERKRNV